ncbi:MAG: hypothetical protein MUE30_14355 [Spirosomaceae bacterium]|nr:hypothetical protein [Spirosomataceae bacterium]
MAQSNSPGGIKISMESPSGKGSRPYFVPRQYLPRIREEVLEEEKPQKVVGKLKDFEWQSASINKQTESLLITTGEANDAPQTQWRSETQYVRFQNDTLEWIVTPMTTPKDILAIQKEFHKIGASFSMTHTKYDPLNHHLLDMGIRIDRANEKNMFSRSTSIEHFAPKYFLPVIVSFGKMNIKNHYTSFGGKISCSPLYEVALADQKNTEEWYNANRQKYLNIELREKRNGIDYESSQYRAETLKYFWETGTKNQIYFTPSGLLRLESDYSWAECMIDEKVVKADEIEKLKWNDLVLIMTYNFGKSEPRNTPQKLVSVYTKNFIKP